MKINQRSELAFYERAFKHHKDRRERRFGSWEYTPSESVSSVIKTNSLATNSKSKTVLDVGCGDGRHLQLFRDFGFRVVGVDFTTNSIKVCKERFAKDEHVELKRVDLTQKDALKGFGQFDIVNDWSVLDHIRGAYIDVYIKNIASSVKSGGYLILSEFDESIPGLYKGKKYKIKKGHYFRAFSIRELVSLFAGFKLVDTRKKVLEDEINNYRFNTVVLKRED